jgi:hypothetical protein
MEYPPSNVRVVPGSMGEVVTCEYKDCDSNAVNYTIGGAFGVLLHCDFHSIRCIGEGLATSMSPIHARHSTY